MSEHPLVLLKSIVRYHDCPLFTLANTYNINICEVLSFIKNTFSRA